MSGNVRGTQAMLSQIVDNYIPYIPCQAHRLNTFMQHACDSSLIVAELFNILEALYVFFHLALKGVNT